MVKLQEFSILLDNPAAAYAAGQRVTVNVVVHLAEPMTMRVLEVKFKGKAEVKWTEMESHSTGSGSDRHSTTSICTYSSEEKYFSLQVALWKPNGDEPHPAGRFLYPIHFDLPTNIPSSFEGEFGHVRYTIEGKIDKPLKFDHNVKKVFSVTSILDLNLVPNVRAKPHDLATKTLGCLCCESGPITASLTLSKSGFVPGEQILVTAEVTNNSNKAIPRTQVKLIMTTTFHATSKSRCDTHTVAKMEKASIAPGDTGKWALEGVRIPPVPPSDLVYCKIIDVKYSVLFGVDLPMAFNLVLKIPVTIGTIPLYEGFQSYPAVAPPPVGLEGIHPEMPGYPGYPPAAGYPSGAPGYAPAGLGYAPTGPGYPPAGPGYPPAGPGYPPAGPGYPPARPGYPPAGPGPSGPPMPGSSVPPPSYEECMMVGKVNIRDEGDNEYTRGDMEYTPRYTYYANM